MSNKEQNRQKKLARKKAKRKAKSHSETASLANTIMKLGMDAPLIGCNVYGDPDQGMMSVSAFRQVTAEAGVAIGFCVDLYCLGVKDCFAKAATRDQFDDSDLLRPDTRSIEPEDAKKLIEGAVDFAATCGFEPHKDYKKAIRYLHDVDSGESSAEFKFGKDGKPLFINGPNDSQEKCDRIRETLDKTVGEGNYSFILGGPPPGFF